MHSEERGDGFVVGVPARTVSPIGEEVRNERVFSEDDDDSVATNDVRNFSQGQQGEA